MLRTLKSFQFFNPTCLCKVKTDFKINYAIKWSWENCWFFAAKIPWIFQSCNRKLCKKVFRNLIFLNFKDTVEPKIGVSWDIKRQSWKIGPKEGKFRQSCTNFRFYDNHSLREIQLFDLLTICPSLWMLRTDSWFCLNGVHLPHPVRGFWLFTGRKILFWSKLIAPEQGIMPTLKIRKNGDRFILRLSHTSIKRQRPLGA